MGVDLNIGFFSSSITLKSYVVHSAIRAFNSINLNSHHSTAKIQIIIEFINTSGGNLRNIRLIRTVAQTYSLPSMMLMTALTSAMSTWPSPVTSA